MIRITYTYLKPVALFLAIVLLFQCCVIYDNKPVNIDEAVAKAKVKIITNDGEKLIFNDIYYKSDGKLYGLSHVLMLDTIEFKISKTQVKEIKTNKNRNKTNGNIKTLDGKKYVFDYYYDENDTLYANRILRRHKETLIPKNTIKEIRTHNPAKSTAGTVFLILGTVVVGIAIWIHIECDGNCNDGWFSAGI